MVSSDITLRDDSYNPGASDSGSDEYNKHNQNSETESNKRITNEMTTFMDDLSLNSPKERPSRSRSRTQSSRRTSSCSSSSSSSGSSSVHSSWSRSRSRSRDRRYRHRKSRRSSRSYSRGCSRSYSRSRSRSYSPRRRSRYSSAYRRYYRSPPRYRRSRSRSHSRSYHRSRYSRSRSRSHGRRFYGFVRRHYSPTYRSWRSRSRTRSCERTLHLSNKEKLELLEIAKMNASRILGKQVELPESLKRNLEQSKSSTETDDQRSEKSRSASCSSTGSETFLQEKGNASEVQTEIKHKSPYMLWRPVTSEAKSFSKSLSPKEQKSRNR